MIEFEVFGLITSAVLQSCLINMDQYLKQPERAKDYAANVSTADRAKHPKFLKMMGEYFVDPAMWC